MRITIEIERPRRLRRTVAVVAALAFTVGAVGVATGGHLFTDVPTSSSFHAQISAIARAGITTGCGAGSFCPASGITRGQEAALLHRGLSRVAMFAEAEPMFLFGGNTYHDPLGEVTIVVPGSNGLGIGASQFVKVDGHVTVTTDCSASNPFTIELDNDTDIAGVFGRQSGYAGRQQNESPQFWTTSVSTSWVFTAAPGAHTYYFRIESHYGDCSADRENVILIATTYPFGASGTNVLDP